MKSLQESEVMECKLEEKESNRRRGITLSDIRDHTSGPMMSLIVHVIAIAFISTIIVFKAPDEGEDIEVEHLILEPPIEIKIPEFPELVEPDDNTEKDTEEAPTVEVEDVDLKIEVVSLDTPDVSEIKPPVLNLLVSNSSLVAPIFQSRSPKSRGSLVRDGGGSTRTERAVDKGLRWLKDHQNPDGSWGDSNAANRSAFTSFALLAFLARGLKPVSPEFGPTVLKAIKRLVEYAGPSGKAVKGGYRHGIVMYALSEAYGVTQIPMLAPIVNGGIKKIVDGINDKGSFNYGYNNEKMRCDLSVAGWNYQALKAAFVAGSTVVGLENAIDKAVNIGLKKTHAGKGGFSYGEGGGTAGTMTSVGTLCLQLMGEGKSSQAKAGLATLELPRHFWVQWKGLNGKVPHWGLYQWYYQTQALFQGHNLKGRVWKKWNRMFTKELVRKQKSDGRWESPAFSYGKEKGKGHGEQSFKGLDQPVYSTALCCLMLEVYYRYLPTFNIAKSNVILAKKDEDDLGIALE
jgi:hypothetical protein